MDLKGSIYRGVGLCEGDRTDERSGRRAVGGREYFDISETKVFLFAKDGG